MTLPLVLLPGMMCDARLFAPQIAHFSRQRAVHVAALTGADSTAALAAQVLAHAPPRFALAGLSMGGIIAMEMMAQAPERITALALLDTNPLAELPEHQARRTPQIDAVRAGGLEAVMREQLMPWYLPKDAHRPDLVELCLDMARDLGADVFIRQSLALRDRPDRSEVLRAVQVPSLVLCGRHDRLCPVARHELMHSLIPGARLAIIEGAGHMPTLETPKHTNTALARWLED